MQRTYNVYTATYIQRTSNIMKGGQKNRKDKRQRKDKYKCKISIDIPPAKTYKAMSLSKHKSIKKHFKLHIKIGKSQLLVLLDGINI